MLAGVTRQWTGTPAASASPSQNAVQPNTLRLLPHALRKCLLRARGVGIPRVDDGGGLAGAGDGRQAGAGQPPHALQAHGTVLGHFFADGQHPLVNALQLASCGRLHLRRRPTHTHALFCGQPRSAQAACAVCTPGVGSCASSSSSLHTPRMHKWARAHTRGGMFVTPVQRRLRRGGEGVCGTTGRLVRLMGN
jgi:hypothetical protein